MDPYRRFYEPNYIAPQPVNPPQASRTGQRSLSRPISTPASEEVTGYPPPLDWANIIDDGPPLPGTPYYPYYSQTRNSHQGRTTSVVNPALNGIASIAHRHSPVSSYRTDCEYGEYPSQPPARDNPFYPPPLNDYRRPSEGHSTLSRLRSVTPSLSEESRYAPERHRRSYAPEASRPHPQYHHGRRTHRSRTHNAPPPSDRTYEYLGYDGSEGDLTPTQRSRVESWANSVVPGSPQESVSQAQPIPVQSHNTSSTQTATYCMNCKYELKYFSLRCIRCYRRHYSRQIDGDSSREPVYCIRCTADIDHPDIFCREHKQDTGFVTQERQSKLEKEGMCCNCWIEEAERGSDRCASCRARSGQLIVDETETGPQKVLCFRCEERASFGSLRMCRECLDFLNSRFELCVRCEKPAICRSRGLCYTCGTM